MNIISKTALTLFEIVNELYIAVGAGVVGIGILINHGFKNHSFIRTLAVVGVSTASLVYVFQAPERKKPNHKQIVFITGCDSGLGFSLAQYLAEIGFTVFAGVLSKRSEGALELAQLEESKIHQVELDITKSESIDQALKAIETFIDSNSTYELYAIINNAAVMVFGEFEWQTDTLVLQQLNVNLVGTFRVTKAFLPLLRKFEGRVINITSHCALACLPGLAVYGATKTGLAAFSDGLRVELRKYGVQVISVIPGSFFMQSNLMAKHQEHVRLMKDSFTQEQHAFYDDYFHRYNAQLLGIPVAKKPQKLSDQALYNVFEDALLNESPQASYKVEPFRYALYHTFFKWSPPFLRDFLVLKFMQMPEYSVNHDQTW